MSFRVLNRNDHFRLAPVLGLLLASTFVGCKPQSAIRQYTVKAESERIVTSDLLKSEFGAVPFQWQAPKSWTVAENDQFSKFAWEVGTKADSARVTVSAVSMGMGLMSQLTRWRGQIGISAAEGDDPMSGTEQLDLGGTTATFIDFKGEEQTILGMMFSLEEKLWVFKFRGSNAVADKQRERFRKFCESVEIPN